MPSARVPNVARYQSPTMSTPSGFCDGTSMMIVLARIDRASGVSARARRSASTIGVVKPPTSVEWMLDVIRMTFFPSSSRRARSSAA